MATERKETNVCEKPTVKEIGLCVLFLGALLFVLFILVPGMVSDKTEKRELEFLSDFVYRKHLDLDGRIFRPKGDDYYYVNVRTTRGGRQFLATIAFKPKESMSNLEKTGVIAVDGELVFVEEVDNRR
ncbi:MAG TPA: hypothetical protein VIW47_11235 [Nitrospiraceae bacterium]|jgi:hypothetical protein